MPPDLQHAPPGITAAKTETPSSADPGRSDENGASEAKKNVFVDDGLCLHKMQWGLASAWRLVTALGGEWHGNFGLAPCPVDPSHRLGVVQDRHRPRVKCLDGCSPYIAENLLRAKGYLPSTSKPPRMKHLRRLARQAGDAFEAWRTGKPLEGSPAGKYLKSLGLPLPDELRCGSIRYDGYLRLEPALLGALHDLDGREVGVLGTAVDCSGDGPPRAKGRFRFGEHAGAAVQLGVPGSDIGLVAGLLEAIAFHTITGLPVLCVEHQKFFATAPVPSAVNRVHVAVGQGKLGREYFLAARQALQKLDLRLFEKPAPAGARSFLDAINTRRAA